MVRPNDIDIVNLELGLEMWKETQKTATTKRRKTKRICTLCVSIYISVYMYCMKMKIHGQIDWLRHERQSTPSLHKICRLFSFFHFLFSFEINTQSQLWSSFSTMCCFSAVMWWWMNNTRPRMVNGNITVLNVYLCCCCYYCSYIIW